MSDSGSNASSARSRRTAGRQRSSSSPSRSDNSDATLAAGLSFNEARTALDLTLEALQASDLAIEDMAGLYRRANAYAQRCQQLLETVEQDVIQWEGAPPADG